MPARGGRISSKSLEAHDKRASLMKAKESAPQQRTTPSARKSPKVAKPLVASEPRTENVFATATLPSRPPTREIPYTPRVVHISMVEEKIKLVSSLLLRAGVPSELITRDNRAQAVIDNFTTYLRAPVAQTLYRYDFGRQFVTRGDVPTANRAADIVLPLLLSETKRDLAVQFSQAEAEIQREILPVNLP